jgi:predicted ATPase/class 3 adenylate cyclase
VLWNGHHSPVTRELPWGTVTFLFTDVEGSTRLLHALGAEAYARELAEHRRVLRDAFAAHGGVEVDTQGDALFYAFSAAPGALAAARAATEALAAGPIRVRMGLHTGTPHLTGEGYVGEAVHLGARIAAAAHGGQVLLSQATRDLVDGELTDLGEHRLKDFADPVWIFQFGAERFPPLRTISNTNLPRPASSFVGRERELSEVTALIRGGARFVTLSGPGGSGKTRLAIEAAAELVPKFHNGIFWVGLAPLRDSALVAGTIAQTLGAKDGLADHIGERELLLLLDNLEQVIEAAPELASLVESCPYLCLLVTSRELLRVRGEVEYPVSPLAEPEAVELFSARSRLAPDETIAELCRRLDSLPLAVELAAARTSVLSPVQILERLSQRLDLLKGGRDSEARQQTLRATIEWSYDLLSEEEQRLFARLSVFAGGCTLEAAEKVAGADLDRLQSLVDKNLLRQRDERFWMLETIREYASERLEASGGADELRRRHAEHFLALAEEVEPNLFGASPEEWADRLERELDNFRSALGTFEASGESHLALRLVGALSEFWHLKNHVPEGRRHLEDDLRNNQAPTAARAKALNGAATLARVVGETATAKRRAEEALALHRRLDDAWGAANSVLILGLAAADEGDLARARGLFDECARTFGELGDRHAALWAARFLAWMYHDLGDLARARAQHEDNLRQARALNNKSIEAATLGALGEYALDEGRIRDGASMVKEACAIHRELGDHFNVATGLCRFARALVVVGRPERALRLLSCAEAIHQDLGTRPLPWLAEYNERTLATIRAQLDEAAFAEAWKEGRKLTADEAIALALDSVE